MTFRPFSNPLLLVSDNPALHGGLSRMCRDLATLTATMPEFRVAVLGRGIYQNSRLPFVVYDYPEQGGWGEGYIKQAWEDFCHGDPGIIMTLDDLSRRHWFSNPAGMPPDLQKFLSNGRDFKKWCYVPIDSTGPNGTRLATASQDCLMGYDRVLASSEWGRAVMLTSGRSDADWLPHGVFNPPFGIKEESRRLMDWKDGDVHVGCVMGNQSRKDFPAAFECFAVLKTVYGNKFHAWLHTDEMIRYWNVYALAADYGIGDCLEVTQNLSDHQLAVRYSACNCTILPSGGEGFGFPIAESLSCGTACVVADYAAGQELVSPMCRVKPVAYRVDTQHNVLRAVLCGCDFAEIVQEQIGLKQDDPDRAWQLAESVERLNWDKLRYPWIKWMKEGLK